MEPIKGELKYRVIYADTDQMGVVYYGNYGKLYEMGRSEMVRGLGITIQGTGEAGCGDARLFGGVQIPESDHLR